MAILKTLAAEYAALYPSYDAGPPRPLVVPWAALSAASFTIAGCAFANYTSSFASCGGCGVVLGCSLWAAHRVAVTDGVALNVTALGAPRGITTHAASELEWRGAAADVVLRCPRWTQSGTVS